MAFGWGSPIGLGIMLASLGILLTGVGILLWGQSFDEQRKG